MRHAAGPADDPEGGGWLYEAPRRSTGGRPEDPETAVISFGRAFDTEPETTEIDLDELETSVIEIGRFDPGYATYEEADAVTAVFELGRGGHYEYGPGVVDSVVIDSQLVEYPDDEHVEPSAAGFGTYVGPSGPPADWADAVEVGSEPRDVPADKEPYAGHSPTGEIPAGEDARPDEAFEDAEHALDAGTHGSAAPRRIQDDRSRDVTAVEGQDAAPEETAASAPSAHAGRAVPEAAGRAALEAAVLASGKRFAEVDAPETAPPEAEPEALEGAPPEAEPEAVEADPAPPEAEPEAPEAASPEAEPGAVEAGPGAAHGSGEGTAEAGISGGALAGETFRESGASDEDLAEYELSGDREEGDRPGGNGTVPPRRERGHRGETPADGAEASPDAEHDERAVGEGAFVEPGVGEAEIEEIEAEEAAWGVDDEWPTDTVGGAAEQIISELAPDELVRFPVVARRFFGDDDVRRKVIRWSLNGSPKSDPLAYQLGGAKGEAVTGLVLTTLTCAATGVLDKVGTRHHNGIVRWRRNRWVAKKRLTAGPVTPLPHLNSVEVAAVGHVVEEAAEDAGFDPDKARRLSILVLSALSRAQH